MSDYKEFDPPSVHVTRVTANPEKGGRLEEAPISGIVCDFCMDQDPAWGYQCADFVIPLYASAGGFAVCDICADLIDSEDAAGLTARSDMAFTALSGISRPTEGISPMVEAFLAHKLSGRIPAADFKEHDE